MNSICCCSKLAMKHCLNDVSHVLLETSPQKSSVYFINLSQTTCSFLSHPSMCDRAVISKAQPNAPVVQIMGSPELLLKPSKSVSVSFSMISLLSPSRWQWRRGNAAGLQRTWTGEPRFEQGTEEEERKQTQVVSCEVWVASPCGTQGQFSIHPVGELEWQG